MYLIRPALQLFSVVADRSRVPDLHHVFKLASGFHSRSVIFQNLKILLKIALVKLDPLLVEVEAYLRLWEGPVGCAGHVQLLVLEHVVLVVLVHPHLHPSWLEQVQIEVLLVVEILVVALMVRVAPEVTVPLALKDKGSK